MATLTSSLVVRLLDQVSGPAKKAANALRGLNSVAGKQPLNARLRSAIDRNNAALEKTRGKIIDAAAGYYVLKNALMGPVNAAASFEDAMADVRKVVDFDNEGQFASFKKDLMALSQQVPVALDGLAKIAAEAGASGIARQEILAFTEAAAKIGVAFGMSAGDAGESLAKIKTGMGTTLPETILLADAMNQLANTMASKESELVDFTKRVGATGKQFGFSAQQSVAFGSAMISAGTEVEVAATSFRNMGRALTKGVSATKRQRVAFAALGLSSSKVAKKMQKDAVGTTRDVLERISKLPKHVQASVSSDLFGDEARGLGALMTNLSLVDNALASVADSSKYAGSSYKEFAVRAGTFNGRMQQFKNQLAAIQVAVGNALLPALSEIAEILGPIANAIADLADKYPQLTTAIVGATAGLIAFRVAAIAANFVGLNLKGAVLSMALGFTRLGGAARWTALMMGAPFVGVAKGVVGMMQTIALRNRLATASLGATPGILSRVGDAFLVTGRSAIRLLNPLLFLRTAAVVLRGALMFSGVGAVLAAIAGAGTFIYNNWSGVKALIQGVADGFMKGMAPVKPVLEPIGNLAKSIYDSIAGLVGPLDVSTEKWRSWGEVIGGTVATGVRAVVDGIGRIVGLFTTAYEKAVAFGNAIKNITGFGPGQAKGGAPAPAPEVNVGGALAGGGPTRKGTTYLVGEEGPELWTAGANGRVTPNSETLSLMRKSASALSGRSSGGGRSSAPNINMTVPIAIHGVQDIRGAAEELARLFEEKMRFAMRGVYADVGVG